MMNDNRDNTARRDESSSLLQTRRRRPKRTKTNDLESATTKPMMRSHRATGDDENSTTTTTTTTKCPRGVARLQLASLGLRKLPRSVWASFLKVGIGKNLVVVDISQNALRGAVRFFPALSSSSSSSSSSSTSRKRTSSSSPLSNVRYLNVSGNRHLTAIVDLHEFKNLEYFDASETKIGKSVRKGETILPRRVERVKLDACGWIGSCEIEEEEIKAKERENIFAMRMLRGGGGGGDAGFLPNLTHVSLENNGFGPDVPDLTTTGIFSKAKCVSLKNNAISLLSNAGERMRYMERLETIDLSSNDISVIAEFRFLGDEGTFPRLRHVSVADNPLVLRSQHYEYDHIAALVFAFGNCRLKTVDGVPVSSESRKIASTMLFRDDSGLAMDALYENLYLNASDENACFLGNYLRDVCARFYTERSMKKDRKRREGGGGNANGLFSFSTFVPSPLGAVVVATDNKDEEEGKQSREGIVKVDAALEDFPDRQQGQTLEDVSTPSSSHRKNGNASLEVAETFSTPAANRTLMFNSPSLKQTPSPAALRSSLKKQKTKSPASTSPVSEAKTNSTQASSYKTARSENLSSDDDDFSAYYHRSPLDEDIEVDLENENSSRRRVHHHRKTERGSQRKSVSFKVMLEDDDVFEDFYLPPSHFHSPPNMFDFGTDERYTNPHSSPAEHPSSVSESPVADELVEAKREMHSAVQKAMEDATPERLRFARIKVRKLVEMKQKALQYFNPSSGD